MTSVPETPAGSDMRTKIAAARSVALRADRRAVTAIEYGLIAALIAVVVIGGVSRLGTNINAKFFTISTAISSATK